MSCVNLDCNNCGAYVHSGFNIHNPKCPKCGSENVSLDMDEKVKEIKYVKQKS